ncbi:MAG TPA: LacI family DNA-binding transcriptional regulator [Anaerolineales bacterium]|nr:LacI family DNA-binding transcriptional regulator [Anaerolineales bacterium]
MHFKNHPPTIADVARHARVSIATVSRVLNGTVPVQREKSERVRLAMDELRFVPRHAARVLASRKTLTLGLILSEIGGAFFPLLLKGIESEARAVGYELLIHSTQGQHAHQRKPLGEHNTDGLLVFTSSLELNELYRLQSINFPVVLMHQTSPDDLHIPAVTVENKDGAEMLVSHLIEKHNRRRIVFLRGPEDHEDSQWRERGYREALKSHKIKFDRKLIGPGHFEEEQAYETIHKMLADGIEIDAVFAGDDDAATGAIRALKMTGRLIPQDVAVVGFDDVPFARYLSPALTTVRAPIEEVGREAVRQLARLMNGAPAEALTLMRTELVIRESCGCTPTAQASHPSEELLAASRR